MSTLDRLQSQQRQQLLEVEVPRRYQWLLLLSGIAAIATCATMDSP